MGEFLRRPGVQLIVFLLPVQADVRAEHAANRSAGCLHVRRWPSPPVRLRNVEIFSGEGLHSADKKGDIYPSKAERCDIFPGFPFLPQSK